MKENFKVIGRLASFLKENGKTQLEISKQLRLSPKTISEIFSGKRPLRYTHALSLQAFYGVSADWLLTGKGSNSVINQPSQPSIATETPQSSNDISQEILQNVKTLRDRQKSLDEEIRNRMETLNESIKTINEEVLSGIHRIKIIDETVTVLGENVRSLSTLQLNMDVRLVNMETKTEETIKRIKRLEKYTFENKDS